MPLNNKSRAISSKCNSFYSQLTWKSIWHNFSLLLRGKNERMKRARGWHINEVKSDAPETVYSTGWSRLEKWGAQLITPPKVTNFYYLGITDWFLLITLMLDGSVRAHRAHRAILSGGGFDVTEHLCTETEFQAEIISNLEQFIKYFLGVNDSDCLAGPI